MESKDKKAIEDDFSPTYEHYSDDVEVGANQSNAGTLALNQHDRRDRWIKPIIPHISRIHAAERRNEENWRLM